MAYLECKDDGALFQKILIANRGEIACRVIASAKKMGIATVAVYSKADEAALHVRLADQAIYIGESEVKASYLNQAIIIKAALESGAEAIHPGYGFLSENPVFCEAVQQAGLVFIGAPAASIRAMGLKDAAKALMEKSGVPVVKGYHGDNQDSDFLANQANEIGYPIMIKARAGGGGKGMRRVDRAKDFMDALISAKREALHSFGDDSCILEKFIISPRHIEIQVFADNHGNIIHLYERDCSLQRRHQKVIEEAPAPGLPTKMREAMGKAAIEAARAIGYQGAGTVEFIVSCKDGLIPDGFWFMEMNTRLQVEHPITEAITGLDLVELQIAIAAGAKLPLSQDQVKMSGHAFEARLYAEDPNADFLPMLGKLEHLRFPESKSFTPNSVRVDSGVQMADQITPFYDPMIAKLIVHGDNRSQALQKLTKALSEVEIVGLTNNIPFLLALSQDADFANGRVDTGLIERHLISLTLRATPSTAVLCLAALAGLDLINPASKNPKKLLGWRAWGKGNAYISLLEGTIETSFQVAFIGDNQFKIISEAQEEFLVKLYPQTQAGIEIIVNGQNHKLRLYQGQDGLSLFDQNGSFHFKIAQQSGIENNLHEAQDQILAPMSGKIIAANFQKGDWVEKGQILLILEAMKMEHSLIAPQDAEIEEIFVEIGMQVQENMRLIRFKTDPEKAS